ncbi:hypothetical protein GCM10009735_17350 [Actinomadura chokoriensis]
MRIAPNPGAQPARQPADTSADALPMDTDQVKRDLERLFPGVIAWFGGSTGRWWAMLGDRLLEAGSPRELADMIRGTVCVRPAKRVVVPQARRASVPSPMGAPNRRGLGGYVR